VPKFELYKHNDELFNMYGHNFGRGPSKDHSTKVLLQLAQWFQTRRILWEFPIGSYVKLSSAVVVILVGGLKCRTQFWKGTTQGSNFAEIILRWSSFKIVSVSAVLYPRWPPLLKIEISSNGQNFYF
jgi:hypothetical protein